MASNSIVKKRIDLPAPPSNWNDLSAEQLRGVHRLMNSGLTVTEYKLRVFLLLMGLKVLKRADKKDDGSFVYKFRRKGWKYLFRGEELSMEAWEVDYWINRFLGFLDKPFDLLVLPFDHWTLRGRRYKAPDPQMVNLTYEQYSNAQRYLVDYWEAGKVAESLLKNGATRRAVRHARRQALEARAGFLAHLYTAPRTRLLDQSHQMTRVSMNRVYVYSSEEAERNKKHFHGAPQYLFDVTYQLFQSSQQHYKEDFPFLFKEYQDGSGKSALVMEVETINAVMKYAGGYSDQQAVYDSNAVFIFGFLNSMAHEADEIEKMNRSVKRK